MAPSNEQTSPDLSGFAVGCQLFHASWLRQGFPIADGRLFTYSGIMNYSDIITIEPGKRGGKPCIRGLRITVYDVLDYLASGMSHADILREFPYLTEEGIRACLAYAADRERKVDISNA
jgi:uncharacterized protein (DUF433 family)